MPEKDDIARDEEGNVIELDVDSVITKNGHLIKPVQVKIVQMTPFPFFTPEEIKHFIDDWNAFMGFTPKKDDKKENL